MGKFMSQTRWEQIHRFLTFNADSTAGDASFFDKVEPVASIVRRNCADAVIPSSWLSVDEAMVSFKGRSEHTTRLQGKPIGEGYKIWTLCCRGGYVVDWLFYSAVEGSQGCLRRRSRLYWQPVPLMPVFLAETYQVPVELMERLVTRLPRQNWLLFLDNLFLTVDVVHVLLLLGVVSMGTARSKSANLPPLLRDIKALNTTLLYGGFLMIQCGWALAFAWQDNNIILGITTAYSLHRPKEDFVVKERWRPKDTATNYAIARRVFGDKRKKPLPIPRAINDYNHGMLAVDNHNQLRRSFSSHLCYERRIWRPLGFWLFDVPLTNAYTLWRERQTEEFRAGHREHEAFEQAVILRLLHRGGNHQPTNNIGKRSRCRWGILAPGECLQESRVYDDDERGARRRRRRALAEISGNSAQNGPAKRPRNVQTGCVECAANLCTDRACFYKFHTHLYEKAI
jgi:hypothetical protein